MTEPLRQSITHLDWTVTCCPPKFLGKQQPTCTEPAVHWVEFHMTGRCTHPACNESGNLEYLVCDTHLAALEASAGRTVRKLHPPAWVKWFRVDPYEGRCPTCQHRIELTSDVLQVVRRLEAS